MFFVVHLQEECVK